MMAWPVSDHFDGERFFNPTWPQSTAPTLRSLFKMLREPRSRWPRPFENKGTPRLHETLAIGDIAITFVNHATFLIQTVRYDHFDRSDLVGAGKPFHLDGAKACTQARRGIRPPAEYRCRVAQS